MLPNPDAPDLDVLVVDDNQDDAEILICYLIAAGVLRERITVINRGDLALKALDSNPDLTIVDLTLPRVSGADVVREACERGLNAHLVTTHTPLSKADANHCKPKTALPMLTAQWVADSCFKKMKQRSRKRSGIRSWWTQAVSMLWSAV